jgi:hypothetical protein
MVNRIRWGGVLGWVLDMSTFKSSQSEFPITLREVSGIQAGQSIQLAGYVENVFAISDHKIFITLVL